jgi:hypothetical protein
MPRSGPTQKAAGAWCLRLMATKVEFNKKTNGIELETYASEPVRLQQVKSTREPNLTMMLIQLLLPSTGSGDDAALRQAIAETRSELVERFGGVTAFVRSPARGAWRSPQGDVEHDDVVMVEVIAREFDRAWWREYAAVLEQRFSQQSVMIRAGEVSVLD